MIGASRSSFTDSTGERVRILYLVGGERIGGMETHLLHLIRGLSPVFDPYVCCINGSDAYLSRIREAGISVVNLGIRTLWRGHDAAQMRHMVRLVRRFRPAIVHSYGFLCDAVAPMLRVAHPGLVVITTRRGEDRARTHQRIRGWTSRWCHRVICVAESAAAFARHTEALDPGLIVVIPNGVVIPPPRQRRSSSGRIRFGTLGTVKPIKGTDLLVEAFERLPLDLDAELDIGGLTDRPWAQELIARATASSSRISFAGYQADNYGFLSGLDVFVLPSRSEGMSNALLEAMAVGLPSIVTNVGSNAAIVGQGTAGIVCPPDVASLADAMLSIARCEERRAVLARNAITLAENYSMRAMVRHHEDIYRELLLRPSRSARLRTQADPIMENQQSDGSRPR